MFKTNLFFTVENVFLFIPSVLFLFCLVIFPLRANARQEKYFSYEEIIENSTLNLEIDFEVTAQKKQIIFLLQNIDLTCDIIRFLKLERFEAREVDTGIYRAGDNAGLEGYIYKEKVSGQKAIFSGHGNYSGSRLPFSINGRTVLETEFDTEAGNDLFLKNNLHIQLTNTFLHFTIKIFSPLVRTVAEAKADNLKNVARKGLQEMNKQSKVIHRKLINRGDKRAEEWKLYFIKSEGRNK
jgi:hypothetical protein